jgi:putative hydrolase of the HAD superfamily
VSAREVGASKPQPAIFRAAVEKLGVAPHEVLHVGDDPVLDVGGARAAGLRTAWINRRGEPWPVELGEPPELDLPDLTALADWLDRHA